MGLETKSFNAYGFRIEVHAGGRRVWPPSFKRFVKEGLDSGQLTLAEVMRDCNVSQSLVYKWRADVRRANEISTDDANTQFFSEIVLEDDANHIGTLPLLSPNSPTSTIELRFGAAEISIPTEYPVENLIQIIKNLGEQK